MESKTMTQAKKMAGNGRRADRDLAAQVDALRALVQANEERLAPLLWESAPAGSESHPENSLVFYDSAEMEERKMLVREARERAVLTELQRAEKLGPVRELAATPDRSRLANLAFDYPHLSSVVSMVEQHLDLAEFAGKGALQLPPLLLSGPPGVGKTAFATNLAACMNLPFRRVDIGAATAGFVLSGSDATWSSGKAGSIWNLLLQGQPAAGVLLLDEIDKAADSSYPVLGSLYTLLERSTARQFRDEFVDLTVDASNVFWIATCNDVWRIDSALRSRFHELKVKAPSATEMINVVRSIHRSLRQTASWSAAFEKDLPDEVLDELVRANPREVQRLLGDAFASAASERRRFLRRDDVVRRNQPPTSRRVGFI